MAFFFTLRPNRNRLLAAILSILLTVALPLSVRASIECRDVFANRNERQTNNSTGEKARQGPRTETSVVLKQDESPDRRYFRSDLRKYFNRFGSSIKEELKYRPRTSVIDDPVGGQEKVAILRELGINTSGMEMIAVPDWLEFAVNYRRAMIRRGFNVGEYIRPTLVFYRGENNNREFKFIDPLTESIPSAQNDWKLANLDEKSENYIPFNLPDHVVIRALHDGKFPLLALHDVFHFVAFLQAPDFTKALVSALKRNGGSTNEQYQHRLQWILEFMSYPDPSKRSEINAFLSGHANLNRMDSRRALRNRLDSLSEPELLAYAQALSENYISALVDISGGTSFSHEKRMNFLSLEYAKDFGLSSPLGSYDPYLSDIRALKEMYFDGGPLIKSNYSSDKQNQIASLNPLLPPLAIKEIVRVLKNSDGIRLNGGPMNGPADRPLILSILKDFISICEYSMLASVHGLDLKTFVLQMLDPQLTSRYPAAKFFKEFYPGFSNTADFIP